MAKIIKITFPEKCIGCELCVFEVQRQLNKIGLDESLIRVFRNNESNSIFGNTTYVIELTPAVNDLNITSIKDICPTGVFTIEEVSKNEKVYLE